MVLRFFGGAPPNSFRAVPFRLPAAEVLCLLDGATEWVDNFFRVWGRLAMMTTLHLNRTALTRRSPFNTEIARASRASGGYLTGT